MTKDVIYHGRRLTMPSWVGYIATDATFQIWGYERAPAIGGSSWAPVNEGRSVYLGSLSIASLEFDWQASLFVCEEAGPDGNVEAIRQALLCRSQVGRAKYGVTTENAGLSFLEWLQHLQEELMDASVYVEAQKARAKNLELLFELMSKYNPDMPMGDGFKATFQGIMKELEK